MREKRKDKTLWHWFRAIFQWNNFYFQTTIVECHCVYSSPDLCFFSNKFFEYRARFILEHLYKPQNILLYFTPIWICSILVSLITNTKTKQILVYYVFLFIVICGTINESGIESVHLMQNLVPTGNKCVIRY